MQAFLVRLVLATATIATTACSPPRAGDTRPPPCVSATLSPYHLAFPIVNVMLEQKAVRHLGIAEEIGVGSYATAGVGQLGVHARYYPAHAFDGVFLGAFSRANLITYPSPQAVLTFASDGAEATHVISGDASDTRANGRSSIVNGLEFGWKLIATGVVPSGKQYAGLRGFTADLSLQFGWLHLAGASPYGPSPDAASPGDHLIILLGMRGGWSL
jgi:hypothetical protein